MRYDISDETYTTHEHDVVVIGAGGAGLRAAIAASQEGASVALVCKSMLGKAHTVMAEGGAAAALANKDPRDSWKVHFRDTMKGGKYLNDCRDEFPDDWFKNAKLSNTPNPQINYFGLKSRQSLDVWRTKGWILEPDPRDGFSGIVDYS